MSLKVLVLRFSSMGDIILSSSIPSFLKSELEEKIELYWLTSNPFDQLIENHPAISKSYSFNRKDSLMKLRSLVQKIIKDHQIDMILDLHGTLRSLFIRLAFPKIPRIAVDKRTIERFILCFFKIDFLSIQYQSNRKESFGEILLERLCNDFSSLFNKEFNKKKLTQWISLNSNKVGKNQLSSITGTFQNETAVIERHGLKDKKYIVFVPSASFKEKRWKDKNFKTLIEKLLHDSRFNDYQFVISAGPSDHFCELFNNMNRVVNLQGKTSLVETMYLVKNAVFCLGNDTGVTHMAESVGTNALFILGPTGEEFGFYPHLKGSKTVSLKMWCRPCTTNGKGNCIRSKRFCLENITVEMVFNELIQCLEVQGDI